MGRETCSILTLLPRPVHLLLLLCPSYFSQSLLCVCLLSCPISCLSAWATASSSSGDRFFLCVGVFLFETNGIPIETILRVIPSDSSIYYMSSLDGWMDGFEYVSLGCLLGTQSLLSREYPSRNIQTCKSQGMLIHLVSGLIFEANTL